MNRKTQDFYDAHPFLNEKTRHSHKRLSENTVKLHWMANSTQELHATQRKTTQISAKYANKYTQNMGLATAGGKNERNHD